MHEQPVAALICLEIEQRKNDFPEKTTMRFIWHGDCVLGHVAMQALTKHGDCNGHLGSRTTALPSVNGHELVAHVSAQSSVGLWPQWRTIHNSADRIAACDHFLIGGNKAFSD